MTKSLWKNKIWLVFLFILVSLVPATISLPAQTQNESVILAVGLDKIEQRYVISSKVVIPKYESTYQQNAQMISSSGENFVDALSNLSIQLGKVTGLSHCSAIIIGSSLQDENLATIFDLFLRGKRINYNMQIIYATIDAKDLLKKAIEVDQTYNQNLNDIVQFNEEFVNAKSILLSDFLKTYYNHYGINYIPIVELVSDEYNGISSMSGNQQSSSSSSSLSMGSSSSSSNTSEQSNQYFSNRGKAAVVKDGKIIYLLNENESKNIGFIEKGDNRGIITISNVTDENLVNSTMVLSIRKRKLREYVDYSNNNIPRIHYKQTYTLKVEQIIDENGNNIITNENINFLTLAVRQKIIDKIKSSCSNVINLSKEINADLFNVYTTFDRYSHNKWQNYLNNIENKNDYVQKVEYFIDVLIANFD